MTTPPGDRRRRLYKGCGCGCAGLLLLPVILLALLFMLLDRGPRSYPPVANPIPPAAPTEYSARGLDGFGSPYLGHTGSWDGKGGGMFGASKVKDLDKEAEMELHWTFMPVYWSVLEKEGPVDLAVDTPPAWKAVDAFVAEARRRKLNILMQPVIGGNAGGPPKWAGRRERGKSAPADMEAAAAFVGKLAARYMPGGMLAARNGWGRTYGVRAWELDNEPDSYLVSWQGQAGDYAEFAARAAARVKKVDLEAMLLLPAPPGGGHAPAWIEAALDAEGMHGSPAYRKRGVPNSIGPVADGVSFHLYEGLDTSLAGSDRTVERAFTDIRELFERWESRSPGFHYGRRREYWHTEGNFDLIGALSAPRRAAWRVQFFTRAFAAGIRKVCVMDASGPELAAVKGYVAALPQPFPMQRADADAKTLRGKAAVFRHRDGSASGSGRVWVLWAVAGAGDSTVELPVLRHRAVIAQVDGSRSTVPAPASRLTVELKGDAKMAPPVLVIDRPEGGP